jgi:uncharacterized protein (TIGR03118 family)
MMGLAALASFAAHGQSGTNSYTVANLASDQSSLAPHVDPFLINPFGLARPNGKSIGEGEWWAANNATGTSTLYYADGTVTPLTVTIPAADGVSIGSPTGVVDFNSNSFAFVSLDGSISYWDKNAKPATAPAISNMTPEMHRDSKQPCTNCHVSSAVLKVSNPLASYSGATEATYNFKPTLYVANSNSLTIEAYDTNFQPVKLPAGAFTDAQIPAGFTPNNIQFAGGKLWVAYANGTPTGGYVDGFTAGGKLSVHLQQNGMLNDPWGVAVAPSNFGAFSGALLVGNTEAGNIAAFNAKTGAWLGNLQDAGGQDLNLPGLWALTFGSGNADAGPTNVLYFTTGTVDFTHGLFGSVTAN